MKSCLYTPSYLEGLDGFGNPRLARNIRYVQYYRLLQSILGFDQIIFADNASTQESRAALTILDPDLVYIHPYSWHLGRGGVLDYPYIWRSLASIQDLIDAGYEKIICIDSDFFVLSMKMARWIADMETGWQTGWSEKYGFPEASVSVLCADAFPIYQKYMKEKPWQDRVGEVYEVSIPWTHIEQWKGDRWGEDLHPMPQQRDWDYCAQVGIHHKMEFQWNDRGVPV